MFPEEFEYRDDMEDSTVLLRQGKQLLDTYYLSDFEQVQMYRAILEVRQHLLVIRPARETEQC